MLPLRNVNFQLGIQMSLKGRIGFNTTTISADWTPLNPEDPSSPPKFGLYYDAVHQVFVGVAAENEETGAKGVPPIQMWTGETKAIVPRDNLDEVQDYFSQSIAHLQGAVSDIRQRIDYAVQELTDTAIDEANRVIDATTPSEETLGTGTITPDDVKGSAKGPKKGK